MRPKLGVLFSIYIKLGLNMFLIITFVCIISPKSAWWWFGSMSFEKWLQSLLNRPVYTKKLRPQRGFSEYCTLHRFWLSISLIPFQSGFHSGLVTQCGIRLWGVYLSISQSNLTFTMHADEVPIRVFVPNECQICAKHISNNAICLYKNTKFRLIMVLIKVFWKMF